MRTRIVGFVSLAAVVLAAAQAPPISAQPVYDLVLKGGHVIDTANEIDGVMDIAVKGETIARIAESIDASEAGKVVDVSGLYVTPGFVDLHAHPYLCNSGPLFPDDVWLTTGTTTLVACGDAGWRNFDDFKAKIIDRSKARVLAFINIVGKGIAGMEAEHDITDMDPKKTASKILEHPDLIVGIKTAHYSNPDWIAIDRSIEAGRLTDRPIIVDSGILTNTGRTTREKVLDKFRPGDMHTHFYNDRQVEVVSRFGAKYSPTCGKRGGAACCSTWATARGASSGRSRPRPWQTDFRRTRSVRISIRRAFARARPTCRTVFRR